MVSRCAMFFGGLAVLLGVFLKPLASWAVPRLLRLDGLPPADQKIWVHKLKPDWSGSVVRGDFHTNFCMSDRRMDWLEQNFTHKDKDMWVVTYQKVGTTWAQYIVMQILGHPTFGSIIDLWAACPWPEVASGFIMTKEEKLQASAGPDQPQRCFKSHWAHRDFFATLPQSSKVLYILRHAEDVAVSYWHHIHTYFFYYWLERGEMTWDQYFEKFITGDIENGLYMEHVASWWKMRDQPNVMFLRYEDLKKDSKGSIEKIAKFMEVEVSDSRVAEILQNTNLESMKKMKDGTIDRIFAWTGATRGEHVRQGGSSEKEKLVTPAQRELLIQQYNTLLKPLGVPFEYMF